VSEAAPQTRRTFRFVVQYDGRDFEGWQAQSGPRLARTVQGELIAALESVCGESVRVRGAGRTDAGVHAWGQVASVQLETPLAPERIAAAVNARLDRDVGVLDVREAPSDWDALRAAQAKHYRYQIWNGLTRAPLLERDWHWVREPLDLGSMSEAAEVFLGHHDFASMQAAGSSVLTTDRTVLRFDVSGDSGAQITLDVVGEGFLRHMVRNLAGTLIEIGRGRGAPARAQEILAAKDRGWAGPTAPAKGLALVRVWEDLCDDLPPKPRSESVSVDGSAPVG